MRPINNYNNNIQSVSTINNIQIIATPDQLLIRQWEEWARNAQPGEARDTALRRLIDYLERRTDILDLGSLHLTELPANFPDDLKGLNASRNLLTCLPETLPAGLEILHADFNELTHLPETLPAGLRELDVHSNELTYLPDTLPAGIERLVVSYNELTRLPETLPIGLRKLVALYNQLTYLPETLPAVLRALDVSYNQLTRLPETLPTGLEELDVWGNQLTRLPETLPAGLGVLRVNFSELTRLPETLPAGLRDSRASITLPAWLPEGLGGLTISFSELIGMMETFPAEYGEIRGNDNPRTPPDLIKILQSWNKNIDANQWEKIAGEENAGVFFNFLEKLHQQNNAANAQLHHIVSGWLTDLGKDDNIALRQQTFAIAQEGTASCVDRTSYYFNQMYTLLIEHRLIKENASVAETFHTLRGLFRMQELENIAASHVEQRRQELPGFYEDIEIYLAYQYRLAEALGLPVYTECQFEGIANLTTKDLENAKRQVLEKEKQHFLRYLVNDAEVWQKKIGGWNSEKMALVNDSYLDEIASSGFQQDVEHALKMQGISVSDADAMRIMNQKMAEDLLYQKRYPLTEAYLKENNALSLLTGLNR